MTVDEIWESLRTLRSAFPAESDKHTAAHQIVEAYRLALREIEGARVSAAASRDLLAKTERERDALRAELVSLRIQMQPTRLEEAEPATLEGALSSLRLWRAGARHANAKLLSIHNRAGDEATIQRVFEASLDANSTTGAVGSVVRWVVYGNEKDAALTQDLRTPVA